MHYFRKHSAGSAFVTRGFPERGYFPHCAVAFRKQYPDASLLLERRGIPAADLEAGEFIQINLYSDHLSGFPDELFTDRQVNWHSQQFGQKGLIAAAGLWSHLDTITITVLQSDLCQQLYRHATFRQQCKTQLEKRFGYWYQILLNAILDFALERGVSKVLCPTSATILKLTFKAVESGLFERVYDFPAKHYVSNCIAHGSAEYWEIPVSANTNRIVRLDPAPLPERDDSGPTICIFHDTEEIVDTEVTPEECRSNLKAMLEVERKLGVRSTYDVLGKLFPAKCGEIWASDSRHSLAFHSFDHNLEDMTQLKRCRRVDQQVRGYRPPRSVLTPELTDRRLAYLNFEWLASGSRSLSASACYLQNGIVKIPISMDDFPLQTGQLDYEEWERGLIESAQGQPFFAFGLHDCYARHWLPSYAALLEKLSSLGTLRTADEIADGILWSEGTSLLDRPQ